MFDEMTNFTTYAERARREGHLDLAKRIETEGRICSRLVKHALASGYTVSVNDSEEWTVIKSTSYREVMEALFTTDQDTLLFRDADGNRLGTVLLVYGNDGYDVMADMSGPNDAALEAFCEWLKPVEKYADQFEPA
jgi:hypothetical protein